jgi:hypothetical protein
MPWYNENFDSDLEKELDDRKIINDGKFLDLGTKPWYKEPRQEDPSIYSPYYLPTIKILLETRGSPHRFHLLVLIS